jgi:hypothetical protein
LVRVNPPKYRRRHRKVRSRDYRRSKVSPKERRNHDLNYIKTSTSQNVVEHEVRVLDNLKRNPKGLHLRMSSRWGQDPHEKTVSSSVDFPLIDKLGRYTGTVIYKVPNTEPSSFISTVTSTIYKRIFNYSVSRNGLKESRIRQAQLFRCAAYYAISKNSYFLDRILVLIKQLKKNYKTISRMTHKFSFKLDVPTRFVYGHICYQIQWLTFRALKPRDKSRIRDSYFPQAPSWDVREIGSRRYDHIWHTFNKMCHL